MVAKLVFFGVGLLFVGIGVLLWMSKNKLKKECSAQVSGVVSGVEHTTTFKSGKKGGTSVKNKYRATFKYSVGGSEYVRQSNNTSGRPRLFEGQSVTVFYDPSRPERYYVLEEGTQIMGPVLFIAFGIIFMLAAPFATMAQ